MLRSPVILPPRLDELLVHLRIASVHPVPVYGPSMGCMAADHDMRTWVEGIYSGHDFRLRKCSGCEGVEVRDISFDANVGGSRLARRRIDHLLGWYTGQRPQGREYLGSLGSLGSRRT